MKRTTKVSRLRKIIKKGKAGPGGGITKVSPGGGSGPSSGSGGSPPPTGPTGLHKPDKEKSKAPAPGPKGLPDDIKLPEDWVKKMQQQMKDNDQSWNVGATPMAGMPEGAEEAEGVGGDLPNFDPPEVDDEEESRDWSKTPRELEKQVDQAIQDGMDEEDLETRKREAKTDTEKTMGTSGGGKNGTVRDRLKVEALAKIDWGEIFKTRLTAFSNERSKYLPYHRRFVSHPGMRTRIPSREKQMDTIPELNVVIDTSSSLSYKELEIILSEVQRALSSANVKTLNMILWNDSAYHYKQWKDVKKDDFHRVIDDVVDSWQGGGNWVNSVYELMIEKGITKQFTIHLTDGYIQDHINGSSELKELVNKALDPNNTVWGMIYKDRAIKMRDYAETKERFPGDIVPIFVDSDKFL